MVTECGMMDFYLFDETLSSDDQVKSNLLFLQRRNMAHQKLLYDNFRFRRTTDFKRKVTVTTFNKERSFFPHNLYKSISVNQRLEAAMSSTVVTSPRLI